MDRSERRKRRKAKKDIDKLRTGLRKVQKAYSKQPSGRLVFYVLWFCLTYVTLLNYISCIEWLSILYPLTLSLAFLKDLLIDRKLIMSGKSRFVWVEHSGVLLAFITFAIASGLYRVPLIGITSTFMGTDLLIDLMQDIGILSLRSDSRLQSREENFNESKERQRNSN